MSKVYGMGLIAVLMGCSETIETYEPVSYTHLTLPTKA